MEKHQLVAIVIFLAVGTLLLLRDGTADDTWARILILLILLLPILLYRLIAYFASFGFPEFLASDYGSENRPEPYAVFFWIIFLLGCVMLVFRLSVY